MKHLICAFTGILLLSGGFCFADYEIHKDIAYYAPSEIKSGIQKERGTLDLLLPEQRNGFATIIFFHGGGLYDGEKEDVQSYLKKEFGSRKDLAIVTPNYRRYKDVKVVNRTRKLFPAFYQDAAAAVAWVKKNIAKYGGDPDKIYISGHSGGGYLALMLILKKGYLRERKIDPDRDLKACFPISATPGRIPASARNVMAETERNSARIRIPRFSCPPGRRELFRSSCASRVARRRIIWSDTGRETCLFTRC